MKIVVEYFEPLVVSESFKERHVSEKKQEKERIHQHEGYWN